MSVATQRFYRRASAEPVSPSWAEYLLPLLIFAGTRVASGMYMAQASVRQARPELRAEGYAGVITNWDGAWYERIATQGYTVPVVGSADYVDTAWAWAFPPGYPLTVRALMQGSGMSFAWCAALVSCLFGAAAMVLLYQLVRKHGGRFLALTSVLLLCVFVSSPLLQAAYSESMALFLLLLVLNRLEAKSYGWALCAITALALTRLVTPPLAAVIAAHAWDRLRREGRFWKREPGKSLVLAACGLMSMLGAFLWLLISSAFIGVDAGMARTSGPRDLSKGWFGDVLHYWGLPGLTILVCCVVALGLALMSERSAGQGPLLRTWGFVYPVYVLAVTPVMPGFLRYLLLAPTLSLTLIGTPRRRTVTAVVVVALAVAVSLVAQAWYIDNLLVTTSLHPRFAP